MAEAEIQLEAMLVRYLPEVAAIGREAIARLRSRLPSCDALVYDNYNALAVGFTPDGKTGAMLMSVALYPRWVSLFVSARLDDPAGLLKGAGSTLRHVVLGSAADLDSPAISAFVDQSIARAGLGQGSSRQGRLVIKSISAKQRARRPT